MCDCNKHVCCIQSCMLQHVAFKHVFNNLEHVKHLETSSNIENHVTEKRCKYRQLYITQSIYYCAMQQVFQEVYYVLKYFIGYTICSLYNHITIYCNYKKSSFSCIQFHIYLLFINHIYFFSQVSYILFSSQIYEFLYATLEKYLSDSLMLLEGCVMRYILMCINELQCLLQPYKSFYML